MGAGSCQPLAKRKGVHRGWNLKEALRVNREKTVVASISKVKFLGYGFYPAKGGIKLRVHPKSIGFLRMHKKQLIKKTLLTHVSKVL